jgi:hypothetical protein
MSVEGLKQWGIAPLFDPRDGVTVIEPPGRGPGYWAGGCSAIYDASAGKFYLYYRLRKPLDQGRGAACYVAESSDGVRFSPVWTATKEQFGAESIESAALIKSLEGQYRLYISYVNASTRKWDIDLLEAETPAMFDPAARGKIFGAEEVDSEGVKDPYVAIIGRQYYMFVHYAPRSLLPADATQEELHGTGNIFVTDKGKGSAGLALSSGGVHFQWVGDILPPGKHWDRKLTRVDTMLYEPPGFTILYSGRSDVKESYEDRTGIAMSLDLVHFYKLTEDAPRLASPHSTGALRYSDAVPVGDEIFYYYECAREDGSHELRLSRVKRR